MVAGFRNQISGTWCYDSNRNCLSVNVPKSVLIKYCSNNPRLISSPIVILILLLKVVLRTDGWLEIYQQVLQLFTVFAINVYNSVRQKALNWGVVWGVHYFRVIIVVLAGILIVSLGLLWSTMRSSQAFWYASFSQGFKFRWKLASTSQCIIHFKTKNPRLEGRNFLKGLNLIFTQYNSRRRVLFSSERN